MELKTPYWKLYYEESVAGGDKTNLLEVPSGSLYRVHWAACRTDEDVATTRNLEISLCVDGINYRIMNLEPYQAGKRNLYLTPLLEPLELRYSQSISFAVIALTAGKKLYSTALIEVVRGVQNADMT